MIVPDLSRATWRKSSYSSNYGNCVEMTWIEQAAWRKSSHSSSHANCVEVAVGPYSDPCSVGVRDSKNPAGPALMFPVSSWIGFITER